MKHRLILCLFIFLFTVHLNAEYVFYQGYDSPEGDMTIIKNKTRKQKEYFCNNQTSCQGFNTKGNVKDSLKPVSEWTHWTFEPNQGFYRKIVDYVFTQGLDGPGTEIVSLTGQTVAELKVYCHEHPECVGFNTLGSVRSQMSPQSEWTRSSDDPKAGFYMKKGYRGQAQDQSGGNTAGNTKDTTEGDDTTVAGSESIPATGSATTQDNVATTPGGDSTTGSGSGSATTQDNAATTTPEDDSTTGADSRSAPSTGNPTTQDSTATTTPESDSTTGAGSESAPATGSVTAKDSAATTTPEEDSTTGASSETTPTTRSTNTQDNTAQGSLSRDKGGNTPQNDTKGDSSTSTPPVTPSLNGYNFIPQMDSMNGDIKQVNGQTPAQLGTLCNNDASCLGFNTGGFLKYYIKSQDQWNAYGSSQKEGFYLKSYSPSATPYTYASYSGQDSAGGDISNLPGLPLDQLKAYCDNNPSCVAYNSQGWVKKSVKAPSQLTKSSDITLYVKNSAPVLDGYTFVVQMDSGGNDIVQVPNKSPAELKAVCDSKPECLGFNTDGYLKNSLKAQASFSAIYSNPAQGFYLKRGYSPSATPSTYTSYAEQDSAGGDISNLPGRTLDQLKAYCDDNPSCVAYNTAGYVKNSVSAPSQLTKSSGNTLYVKNSAPVLDGYTFVVQMDSGGNDIVQVPNKSPAELKAVCDSKPECLGFNTDGYLKKALKAQTSFNAIYKNPAQGFYIKKGYSPSSTPSTYISYQGLDSVGGDATNLPGRSVDQLKAYCDDTPSCLAYNTDGWIKSSLNRPTQFSSFSGTLYVKAGLSLSGYTFFANKDSQNGDIRQVTGQTPAQLKALCDGDARCLGFNTYGTMKYALRSPDQWVNLGTRLTEGFYLKQGYSPSVTSYSYTTYQGQTSNGADVTNLPGRTLDQLKAYCDDTRSCMAYNTDGWIKSSITQPAQFSSFNGTLYVKGGANLPGYTFTANRDSQSGDIKQVSCQTPAQLKALCDSDATCLGFNTDGVLKASIKPPNQWTNFGSSATQGIYIKQSVKSLLAKSDAKMRPQKVMSA